MAPCQHRGSAASAASRWGFSSQRGTSAARCAGFGGSLIPVATTQGQQPKIMKIAILDDYQNVALRMADWSPVARRAEITGFNDHVADPNVLVERLLPFDVVCIMRERTPLPRAVIELLPQLKLIASSGARNASIDMAA